MTIYCDIQPDFYRWTEPVARKSHRCCECSAPIEKGEKHFYYSGKWEGDLSTGRQHLLCMEACMWIRDRLAGGEECVPFGGLKEEWAEHKCNGDPHHETLTPLRAMLAKILRRERKARPA